MEITLEKIELVKDRTGVSYKEAKEALEKTEGNVVDAIILIEDTIDQGVKASDSKVEAIVDVIKETIKKGNASKLLIKRNGETVINLPINIGVVGTVLFPWATVAGTIAALGTKCSIEIVKDNGEIVDVSSKAANVVEIAKSKGGVVVDEVKNKGSDVIDLAKDKGKEVWDKAKEKGGEVWDKAKEKGEDALELAKEKASTVVVKREYRNDPVDESEFGDLDLSSIDFSELEDDDE